MKTFLKNYWSDTLAVILVLVISYYAYGDVVKELLS